MSDTQKLKRARRYCFTYFGENKPEYDGGEVVRYLVFQREKCPKTGKLHYQGYVELLKDRVYSSVQKILNIPGAHMTNCNGSAEQNRNYCTKSESRVEGWWEFGKMSRQGTRTDIKKIKDLVLHEGEKLNSLVENTIENFQQLRFAEGLMKYKKPYSGERIVKWFYGPTGTGKTRRAFEEAGEEAEFISYRNGFWLGYDGGDKVIIDELRRNVPLDELLIILDRYPIKINVKGGCMSWTAKEIWITSDRHPNEIYGKDIEGGQLIRRISVLEKME